MKRSAPASVRQAVRASVRQPGHQPGCQPVRQVDLAGLEQLPVAGLMVWLPDGAVPLAGLAGLADWRLCGALSRHLQAERNAPAAEGRTENKAVLLAARPPLVARAVLAFPLPASAWEDPAAIAVALRRAVLQAQGVAAGAWAVCVPSLGPRWPVGQERALQAAFGQALTGATLPPSWPVVAL